MSGLRPRVQHSSADATNAINATTLSSPRRYRRNGRNAATDAIDAIDQTNQTNQINQTDQYDALILAVPHQAFRDQPVDAYLRLLKNDDGPGVVVDVKGVLRDALQQAKLLYWSL